MTLEAVQAGRVFYPVYYKAGIPLAIARKSRELLRRDGVGVLCFWGRLNCCDHHQSLVA